ncbi:MAG: hypothetical protein U5L76_05370 [Patescibacteria group bacterium]|nr:hypothetical protein [Patescibacteria group bacterium]
MSQKIDKSRAKKYLSGIFTHKGGSVAKANETLSKIKSRKLKFIII